VEGTNTGHEDGEAMASVGVRLTDQLGAAQADDGKWTLRRSVARGAVPPG